MLRNFLKINSANTRKLSELLEATSHSRECTFITKLNGKGASTTLNTGSDTAIR